MFSSRAVDPVAGDVQSRRVIDVHLYRWLKSVPNLSFFIMLGKKTDSFINSIGATSSASIMDCTVSSYSPILKITGVFESTTMYKGIY